LAAAAYLLGHVDECRLALRRAHQVHVARADAARAARCLFWVVFTLLLEGNLARPADGSPVPDDWPRPRPRTAPSTVY
jgi:heme A synthase